MIIYKVKSSFDYDDGKIYGEFESKEEAIEFSQNILNIEPFVEKLIIDDNFKKIISINIIWRA